MIFPMLAAVLGGVHVVTIARVEHKEGWIGVLDRFSSTYPGVSHPPNIIYFDQRDQRSMLDILDRLRGVLSEGGCSLFVHVEGELARSCRHRVQRLSSVFIDLAQELRLPIVPVRFAGGLPVEEQARPLDFPVGYGRQDYHLGRPVLPDELAPLHYAQRRQRILDAINTLGPRGQDEAPSVPSPELAARIEKWRLAGRDEARAVMLAILEAAPAPSPETTELLAELAAGRLPAGADERRRWLAALGGWLCDRSEHGR
jgi:hypothetical protein